MRQTLAIALTACMGFSPMVAGILGSSCIGALNAMSDLPGAYIENVRRHSCEAGCQPKFDHWENYIKKSVIPLLAEDATKYVGVPNAKDAVVDFLDQVHNGVSADCKSFLSEDAHFCSHPEKIKPFLDCAKSKSRGHATINLKTLLLFASDDNCKKTTEYLKSPTLWEKDFPKHFHGYMDRCREL